ncbi:MAG: class I SAM-dependent methyltransferase [Chthoniobacterales bacterium]
MTTSRNRYDKHYFDKWYRDPTHRISMPGATRRKAALALAVAEYYLERPLRTVLDVGCGEGQWQPILKSLRPGIRYTGIDSSEYAVGRYGKRRGLRIGTFSELATLNLAAEYDLIICSDALYYISSRELDRGMRGLVSRMGGVAFLEAYATTDSVLGDTSTVARRPAAFYRRLFKRHGLVSCGPHCYVSHTLSGCVTSLERGSV